MLITPRPGVDRNNLLNTLQTVETNVLNLRGGGAYDTAYDRLLNYLKWANSSVRLLSNEISEGDLNRLILTRGYEALLGGLGRMNYPGDQAVVNGLVSLEVDQRIADFEAAVAALKQQIARWQAESAYVVADTSFYMRNPLTFDQVDLVEVIEVRARPVHLIVPIVVVDELDSLKKSKDGALRGRARVTLAILDRLFAYGNRPATIHTGATSADGTMTWDITVELLFDPPGHVRLPINDDEIVDRALAIQPLTGGRVVLVTYDTGQSTRGRAFGLDVVKLKDPDKDESAGRRTK